MSPWDYIVDPSNISNAIRDLLTTFLPGWVVYLVVGLVGLIGLFIIYMPLLLAIMWIERKLIGRIQVRYGPNRAGPFGLLQPIADAIKVITKEATTPDKADKWVFWMGPIAAFIPIFLAFAVIPFGPKAIFSDLNIGILYIIAISSTTAVAIFMAGWASNNKYALLSSMRAVAQTISYEIPMVLSVVGVLMFAGSLSMVKIVEAQTIPFVLLQPLGFIIYFICALAELNRSPMDIIEAESELVAGYHTEYSGMKFSLFYMGEYTGALVQGAIIATLFFGGWNGPLLPPWLWLAAKILVFFFVLVWIRGTLPRLRVDQLMGFAWKFLLPLSLINIFITGLMLVLWPDALWLIALINIVAAVGLIVLWTNLLSSGRAAKPGLQARETKAPLEPERASA